MLFGNHRNEPSGSLHGLMRVRGFTQDDGHIFCTEDQILSECTAYTKLVQKVYADYGFTDISYKIATRPEKRIGDDATWDKAEKALYGGDLAQVLLNTAVSKVTLTLPEVLCRAILCNVLVCIAVWAAMSSEQVSGKILALYPPVAIFILCGFEHCIANMFYIPAGLMIMGEYGLAAEGLTIGTFILNNLIPATIGNMIGGMLVIGGGYWLVYLRGTKNREIK